jgi:hypothetical protein
MKTSMKVFRWIIVVIGFIILIMVSLSCSGQSFGQKVGKYLKSNAATLSCLFVAGGADGFAESLKFHYPSVKRKLNLSDAYWNPDVSWRNKYAYGDPEKGNKFFLSTTALVWTTDGYHMSRMVRNTAIVAGIAFKIGGGKQKWYMYAVDLVTCSIAYSAGFNLSYELLK